MNLISDFKLHGISPIYDKVIFVRCHLCQLIIKLPHLVEHLHKRHRIKDDSNETTLSELIISEQKILAVSEEKNLGGLKSSRKASNSRVKSQSLSNEVVDTNGTVTNLGKIKSKPRKLGKDEKNDLKKKEKFSEITATANLPLLSSILDQSIDEISCSIGDSSNLIPSDNDINGDLRFKYVIGYKVNTEKTNEFENSSLSNGGHKKPHNNLSVNPPLKAEKTYYMATNNKNSDSQILNKKNKTSLSFTVPLRNSNTNATSANSINNPLPPEFVERISAKSSYSSPQKSDSVERTSNGDSASVINMTSATKIYDPNRHCGVVTEKVDCINGTKLTREPCTRSLTCKKHSINLRRQVAGRCKSFNELFKEYRDEKLSTSQLVNTNKLSGDFIDNRSESAPSKITALKSPNYLVSKRAGFDLESSGIHLNGSGTTTYITTANSDMMIKPDYQDKLARSNDSANENESSSLEFLKYQNNRPTYYQDNIQNSFNEQYLNHYKFPRILTQDQYQPCFNDTGSIQSSSEHDQHYPNYQHYQHSMFKPFHTGVSPSSSSSNLRQFSSSQTTSSPSVSSSRPLNIEEMPHHLNLNYLNRMLVNHHPRPSAVSSFNARLTDNGGGYTMWDRRQDNLRLLLSRAFSQTDNFLNKNVSFTSCFDKLTPTHQLEHKHNNVKFNNLSLPTDESSFKYENQEYQTNFNQHECNSKKINENGWTESLEAISNDLTEPSKNRNSYFNISNYKNNNYQKQEATNSSKKRSKNNRTSLTNHLSQNGFNNRNRPSSSDSFYQMPAKIAKPNSSVHLINNNSDSSKLESSDSSSLNDVYNNKMKLSKKDIFSNNASQFSDVKSVLKTPNEINALKSGKFSQPLKTSSSPGCSNDLFMKDRNGVKYSSDYKSSNFDMNTGILDSSKTLKSISLLPSPSLSSSASNSSSINTSNNNSMKNKSSILFNSVE